MLFGLTPGSLSEGEAAMYVAELLCCGSRLDLMEIQEVLEVMVVPAKI